MFEQACAEQFESLNRRAANPFMDFYSPRPQEAGAQLPTPRGIPLLPSGVGGEGGVVSMAAEREREN